MFANKAIDFRHSPQEQVSNNESSTDPHPYIQIVSVTTKNAKEHEDKLAPHRGSTLFVYLVTQGKGQGASQGQEEQHASKGHPRSHGQTPQGPQESLLYIGTDAMR